MATTAKNRKKKAPKKLLRGVELIDAVMEMREEDGDELEGLPDKQLDAMKLGKRPLSPALRRWLERDSETFTLGEPQSLTELVTTDFGEEWGELFGEVAKLLPEPIVVFEGWGSDSRRFLYLGKTDALGEYTVMTIDTDDTPFLCVNGPVDVWLAQHAGFLEEEDVYGQVPREYEATRREHAKLNFDGHVSWSDGELHSKLAGDEEE